MKSSRVAWWFVGPALLVIAVFFVLPVLAGLAMSLTDFDIYALADLRNLRIVGLRNYAELLQRPLFWKALGNTLYFVVVGQNATNEGSYGPGTAGERPEAVGIGACDKPQVLTGTCP